MNNQIKKSGTAFVLPLDLFGQSWHHIRNLKRFLKFKDSDEQVYFINNKHIQNEITNKSILAYK